MTTNWILFFSESRRKNLSYAFVIVIIFGTKSQGKRGFKELLDYYCQTT